MVYRDDKLLRVTAYPRQNVIWTKVKLQATHFYLARMGPAWLVPE